MLAPDLTHATALLMTREAMERASRYRDARTASRLEGGGEPTTWVRRRRARALLRRLVRAA